MTEVQEKIKVFAVCGPTASGKTSLSVTLAKKLHAEVVSCDSMQIYRGMEIARQSRPRTRCRVCRTT